MDNPNCVHSCKGLCSALEIAEHRESEAIKEYRRFAGDCDYPDVRVLLEELIREREKGLMLLREKRQALTAKFNAIDNITESFL
jgi:rubrerythrin